MCASTCTCYFTAETVIRNNSDSEMFLVRIIANIWQVINQENWHRLSEHPGESWGSSIAYPVFLFTSCLLYSCSALLCWIIPRVLHLDWVTPTTKLSTDITDHLCISAWWHIWDSVCFTHPALFECLLWGIADCDQISWVYHGTFGFLFQAKRILSLSEAKFHKFWLQSCYLLKV